jgi:hypothetical protein
LAGLKTNSEAHCVRFVLARVLFELGYLKLALRELLELKPNFANNSELLKLIEILEQTLSSRRESSPPASLVLAEAQFDLDEIAKFDQSKQRK